MTHEARTRGEHTVHLVDDNGNAACGGRVRRPAPNARQHVFDPDFGITECADCFTASETSEVRALATTVVHLTHDDTTRGGGGSGWTTVCGEHFTERGSDPRRYQGSLNGVQSPAVTECPTCFTAAAAAPAEPEMTLCTEDRHVGAPEPHYHLTSVTHDTERMHWHSTPGWGAAHPILYRDIPGTFTRAATAPAVEPPTPVARAEHGSSPGWPIYPCHDHRYVGHVHYHVTDTGAEDGSGGTGHNSTVFESPGRHTVQGKRFETGATTPSRPRDTTPERESTMPTTYEVRGNASSTIHKTERAGANNSFTTVTTVCGTPLSRTVTDPRIWRGAPGMTMQECPTCFAPATPEHAFQIGDIVCASTGRPGGSTPAGHLFLVLNGPDRFGEWLTIGATEGTSHGWAFDGRVPHRWHDIPGIRDARFWYFTEDRLTKVSDDEAWNLLPRGMEELRRRIQMEAHGSEPILLCDNGEHRSSAQPHRHAHGTATYNSGKAYYARRPAARSDYIPEPGLWANNAELVTVSRGRDATTPAVDTTTNLHPIDASKVAGLRSVTLVSREGALSGDSVVFGCQTIPLNVIQRQGGTIAFPPSGGVIVTSKATVDTLGLNVGDRVLGWRDINDYTTSVTALEAEPVVVDPDAEVKDAIFAVTRATDPARRRERAATILADLRSAGWDVVKRDA